jgi:N,N'-diacetyllegionaminate synthase
MKVIAESAFNHNGDFEYLKQLAITAKQSGADYFTFQIMDPDEFCELNYSKYSIYQENTFPGDTWIKLFDYCKELDLKTIPCVLDKKSFLLCYEYGYRFYKIHATDILNKPFLELLSNYDDVEIILETQCATYQDIEFALSIIGDKVQCLIHGFSNYPTEYEDLNLDALDYLKEYFPYPIGLADHSLDTKGVPLIAMTKGVEYLEKHITLSRNDRHFDWQASLNKEEFTILMNTIKNYQKVFGLGVKHPVKNELAYRTVMYKKVVSGLEDDQKRSDQNQDYLTTLIDGFSTQDIGIALIARLKSQRLKKKVLKPILDKPLIEQLYLNLTTSEVDQNVWLATSNLEEDNELADLFKSKDYNVFRGHPVSVIDRMLSLAIKEKWGGVFRVTGDNPLTSIQLVDRMTQLLKKNDLDYVRANNFPFGVSAELFSTRYLWDLYLNMENPLHSEYLSWFVLKDENARKGAITYSGEHKNLKYLNYSVDYAEDYTRVLELLNSSGVQSLGDFDVPEITEHADYSDLVDDNQLIKLPADHKLLLKDYIKMIDEIDYKINQKF